MRPFGLTGNCYLYGTETIVDCTERVADDRAKNHQGCKNNNETKTRIKAYSTKPVIVPKLVRSSEGKEFVPLQANIEPFFGIEP